MTQAIDDNRSTLANRAYQQIRTMILYQELRPGERTSVADLSAATGFGREPVKAAMNRLAIEKLLNINGRRGTRVAKLNKKQLQQLFEARRIYEAAAAPLIAERATDEQIETAVSIIPTLGELSGGGDDGASNRNKVVRFIDADVKFHERVISSANNTYLFDHYRLLNLHLLISHYIFLDQGLHSTQRHSEHEAIAQALQDRDAAAIVTALIDHTSATEAIVMNSFNSPTMSILSQADDGD